MLGEVEGDLATPEDIVRAVFERARAGDPAVGDLYALDAVLAASKTRLQGRAAIAHFYKTVTFAQGFRPEIEWLFSAPPTVVAVLQVETPTGQLIRVADVFEVEDGEIRSMRACMSVGSRAAS